MKEISAGGVVFFGNDVLLLKKKNGNWVLPKGRIEADEQAKEAALREVCEETGVNASILGYLGHIEYSYKDTFITSKTIEKTVYWYIMKSNNLRCEPQKEEGFVEARFVHISKAAKFLRYNDERRVIEKAIDIYAERYY